MTARFSALIVATLGITTCVPPEEGALGPPEIQVELLPQRDIYSLQSFSGMATKRGRIITDSAEFHAAWDMVFANYTVTQKPALPAVDFKYNVVLMASAGPTPTQLVWFRITKVRERPEHLADPRSHRERPPRGDTSRV